VNIFASDPDPAVSARALDDLRLNKMIVETCQLGCAVLHGSGRGSDALYRPAYLNHPCALWAAADARHYGWLVRHLAALLEERAWRTGNDAHASRRLLPLLMEHVATDAPPESFVNCTPFKDLDVHEAYRRTLVEKWRSDKRPPRWLRRGPPAFASAR
jgi:hypothetical protein